MSPGETDRAALHARARHADEEVRYRAVAELDPADAGDADVLLAALADASWRVRTAAAERFGAGSVAMVDPLVAMLVSGPDVGARGAAAAALERLGGPAVRPLIDRLGGPEAGLRQAAAAVLGAIGDPRAVAPLAARLADDDPNVRSAAAEALGKIGGAESVAALRAAVESDDRTLRLAAIESLAALRACLPAALLAELLADRLLRCPVYRLLGACDEEGALRLLGRGLGEPSRSAREAALAALGQQRARRPLEALAPALDEARGAAQRDPGLPDAWVAAFASDDPFVAMGAVTAVAAAGAPRHVVAAVHLADDERFRSLVDEALDRAPADPELRAALAEALPGLGQVARVTALAALARIGSPAALESVVRIASDGEAYAQGEAIAALGRLRETPAVAPLAGLLGDEAPSVAGAAGTALVRIGQASATARRVVVAALRDRAYARPSAGLYRALGAIGDVRDLPVLRAGLRSDSVTRRVSAAAALGALAQEAPVRTADAPELVAALADPAWSVRAAAAKACADLARASAAPGRPADPGTLGAEAIAELTAALGDRETAVRAAAMDALGACGHAESAGAIAALALDPAAAPLVVVAALRALSALGGATREVVVGAAARADPEIVKEAVLAAARLPGEAGERILRDASASPRWDVRKAAARAIAERGDPALRQEAERLAAEDPDPLVARAFADAARSLGAR